MRLFNPPCRVAASAALPAAAAPAAALGPAKPAPAHPTRPPGVGLGARRTRPARPPAMCAPYAARAKRAIDVALVVLASPIVAPLVGLLWLIVRAGGGPGFYGHLRVGQNARPFMCWKLRTMVPDADARLKRLLATDPAVAREWQVMHKLADDPRITRPGKLMRRASLDELPQLWNVLKGEMSLVGPRPITLAEVGAYRQAGGGAAYFDLRPGLTGPWQILGRGRMSFATRARFDNFYGRVISLRTDLWLMLRTVGVVVRMTGQ